MPRSRSRDSTRPGTSSHKGIHRWPSPIEPSINYAEAIFSRLSELMDWACITFMTKKSRSLVLKKESRWAIPTISEKPVKSLGRWYTDGMKDWKWVQDVKDKMEDGLKSIDECGLPAKLKIWCLQYGLMPRLVTFDSLWDCIVSCWTYKAKHKCAYMKVAQFSPQSE